MCPQGMIDRQPMPLKQTAPMVTAPKVTSLRKRVEPKKRPTTPKAKETVKKETANEL
jgi:hypothetical protein